MPAGSLVGALAVTQLADRIGRKKTIILSGDRINSPMYIHRTYPLFTWFVYKFFINPHDL